MNNKIQLSNCYKDINNTFLEISVKSQIIFILEYKA